MMNKKIKNATIIAISCFMLPFAVGSDAKAEDVQARGQICGNCGVGTIRATVGEWGPWYDIDEYRCKHGKGHGNDIVQEHKRVVTYKCTTCGIGTSKTERQTRIICKGYN